MKTNFRLLSSLLLPNYSVIRGVPMGMSLILILLDWISQHEPIKVGIRSAPVKSRKLSISTRPQTIDRHSIIPGELWTTSQAPDCSPRVDFMASDPCPSFPRCGHVDQSCRFRETAENRLQEVLSARTATWVNSWGHQIRNSRLDTLMNTLPSQTKLFFRDFFHFRIFSLQPIRMLLLRGHPGWLWGFRYIRLFMATCGVATS